MVNIWLSMDSSLDVFFCYGDFPISNGSNLVTPGRRMVARITLTGVTEPKWPLGERRNGGHNKRGRDFREKNIFERWGVRGETVTMSWGERERDTNNTYIYIYTKKLNINHKWLSAQALDWVVYLKLWTNPMSGAFYRRRGGMTERFGHCLIEVHLWSDTCFFICFFLSMLYDSACINWKSFG